jgi:membrane fusion protein (multidrug efflux system)
MANNKKFDNRGVIETIEADFNNETGNIAFRATFPNPKGILRHGETGNVLMPHFLKDAMLIPQKATFDILDKKFVFVIDENGIVHSRQITIGEEMPHLYVVTEGLSEKDKILLEGLRKVRDKDKIAYSFIKPESALSQLELYAE